MVGHRFCFFWKWHQMGFRDFFDSDDWLQRDKGKWIDFSQIDCFRYSLIKDNCLFLWLFDNKLVKMAVYISQITVGNIYFIMAIDIMSEECGQGQKAKGTTVLKIHNTEWMNIFNNTIKLTQLLNWDVRRVYK